MRKCYALTVSLLLLCSHHAWAIIDDYSTGPGQGVADGLDDVWQALYNAWGMNPAADDDHDGCSNLVECVAGSDPRNPNDCLMVGNMVIGASNIIMNFDGKKGKVYQVWQSNTPGGAAPGQAGSPWSEVSGASKESNSDGADSIVFAKPPGTSKFYRLESKDVDTDGDGVSNWAESKLGTDANMAASPSNASGGVANDLDTARSLMSIQISPAVPDALRKEGQAATVQVQRSVGTMPLHFSLDTAPGAVATTKSSATSSDFILKNTSDAVTNTVNLPSGGGVGSPFTVAKVVPLPTSTPQVPKALKVCVNLSGISGAACPSTTVNIKDADPTNPANRTLYVAFLGREADVVSTASGYATALVDGANNSASIGVVFNNLSSEQNTCYIRIGSDLEVLPLPLGQVSGANWNIRAAQTEVTDQAMLNALKDGKLYVAVSTANNPVKEIFGYFNKANGSATFDNTRSDLTSPALGDATWPVPTGDALEREIWRFMTQSTFGGTTALYNEIRGYCDSAIAGGGSYLDGLSAWLDKQMDPVQCPPISFRQLVMAADMEEFALRGNKPITYTSDPQLNGGSIGVSYVNGMPVAAAGSPNTNDPGTNYPGSGTDAFNRRREWWTMVLQSKDHVRQRVTQALSEIDIISERDANAGMRAYGLANFWDTLSNGAFGKYRNLLESVTLHPMMGVYLTSVANRATYDAGGGVMISPDENYAREIMQLFSIGLVLRHPDGSLQLNGDGLPIATYDNNDITELARVFTGFSHGARHGNAVQQVLGQYGSIGNTTQQVSPTVYLNGTGNNTWFGRNDGHLYWAAPWTTPMKVIGRIGTTVYHDYNTYSYLDITQTPPVQVSVPGVSKRLLANKHAQYEIPVWDPTGKTDAETHAKAAEEVSRAHDCLAGVASASTYGLGTQASPGHTNTPVNISRWLIQRLVTSNPSSGYIYRVQKAYRDNNGLLGPVVKAILLDYEARSLTLADELISHGKIKEPLIHFAAMLRQFRAYSGAPVAALRDMQTGFSDTDAPMSGGYPASELAKFSDLNLSPPTKPAGWPDGPFRFRIDSTRAALFQSPQDAPSVFNWFLPDFQPPGRMSQNGLVAPELQISTEANEVAKINYFYNYTWMTLAGMSSTPGVSGADFIFRNGWATPAARFSTNGGTTLMGWPASIVLDSTNWNTGITLTIVPVNDQKIDQLAASSVRFSVSGSAAGYAGIATPTVPLTFVENEKQNEQLIITQTGGNTYVQELGGTDTIGISLTCPPAAGSTVTVAVAPTLGQVSVAPTSVTFSDSNWNVPQTITITANDDAVVETTGTGNDQLTFTTTSTTANYNGIVTAPLLVNVLNKVIQAVDSDNAYGVLITQSGGSTDTSETTNTFTQSGGVITALGAGVDSYTIVLTKAPTANVTVNCISNGQLSINGAPTISTTTNQTTTHSTTFTTGTTTRVFSPANWFVPQTVVVRGNQDTSSEGPHAGTVTHTITTAAGGYATSIPIQQVIGTIVDDDNSIILTQSGLDTRVMEGDFTDTINVRLRVVPNAQVSVVLGGAGLKFTPAVLTFDPTSAGNLYSIDQTVTISALDDNINQGLHTATITAYSTSTGTNYNGTTSPGLIANIIDNDDSRLLITETGGSTYVSEDGTNDTYSLALGRRPKAGSTTTVALTVGSGLVVSPPGPFTFTDSNWNTPQILTVSASNDSTPETRGTATIAHTISSTDPTYNLSSTPYLVVTIDDNDPPLTIAQSNIFTQVKEGGTAGTGGTPNVSDTFTVLLPRAPAAGTTVTVTLVPNNQITVSPSVLTFTSATTGTGAYNIAQTVTVTAVDDAIPEATVHQGVIGFNIASTDTYYNGAQAPDVLVQVTDNDSPGISLVESSNTTSLTEGGTDTYTVAATQAPAAGQAVVIDLSSAPAGELLLSAVGTLTNCSTVNGTKNVTTTNTTGLAIGTPISGTGIASGSTVSAINSLTSFTLSANATATNTGSTLTNGATTSGSTTVTVASTTGVVAGMAIYGPGIPAGTTITTVTAPSTLILNTAATATGTGLTLTTGLLLTTSRVAAATNYVVFNEVNWATPQTITVTGINDSNPEGRGVVTITHSIRNISDPAYTAVAPVDLKVFTADSTTRPNEGLTIAQTGGSTYVAEGGATDTLLVSLNAPPAMDIPVVMSTNTQVTCSPANLTFTPANWSVPQVVTVTAIDDALVEGNHTTTVNATVVTTTAPLWNGLAATSPTINIVDNDRAGVIINHNDASTDTTEGGATDTYTVQLSKAPNGTVVISATSASTTTGQTVSPTTLTFDASNWSTPQIVTVTAVNDTTIENNHTSTISHAIVPGTSTDTSGYVIPLAACGTTATSTAVTCANTTGLYVGMVLTVNGTGSGIPSGATVASITATGFTLSAAATVTNASINLKANLTGLHTITNNITDNDNRIILTQTATGLGAPATMVNENGTLSDSYDVVLRSAPTAEVTVNLTVPSGQGFATSASSLVFTSANWSTPQTVSITGLDNGLRDRRHASNITHASVSTDANFNAQSIPTVAVTVNTADTAQVIVVESSGSTAVTEASTTDTYTLVLSQAPTDTVTVAINCDSQVATNISSATFTTANWNIAQTITLRAVDDHIVEPILHYGTITHSVTTTDPAFQGLTIGRVVASITDNDSPHITLTQSGGTTVLTENPANAPTDTYTLVLDTQPSADVVITVTPDTQLTASTTTLTFTSANWNTPQTVTLTAVDDAIVEATTHVGLVTHTTASADPFYNSLSVPMLTAQIWDNDSPSIDVTPVGGTDTVITEGGANDSILIKLNTPPAAGTSVTLTLYPPAFFVPPPQIGKTSGYFTNDQGSSNQRDNIVLDYNESIQLYRSTFYNTLTTTYGGTIPANLATSTNATDLINIQNAHWAATKAMIDKMDLWFTAGYLKAHNPVLIEPNQPTPVPMPAFNSRQAIMDAIYRHSGGTGSPSTTRYSPQVAYDPKAPPTSTLETDIRDRVRWAGYLMTVGANAFTLH